MEYFISSLVYYVIMWSLYSVNHTAICSLLFAPSHCLLFCCSWMQIMKHYGVVCELHRRKLCTLWCLFLMAWTSPPYLSWTQPLWEAGTPWCLGIIYNNTHTTDRQCFFWSLQMNLKFTWHSDNARSKDIQGYKSDNLIRVKKFWFCM